MVFKADVGAWLKMDLDTAWVEKNIRWKDFGNGSRLGKVHRDGGAGLVLYHVRADAGEDAFQPHTHTGGEAYLVLRGEVYDDEGPYPAGNIVWMEPGSRHTPRTRGDTWILVLWPGGVEA